MAIDYSLYLVTDNGKAILGDRDLVSVVKSAIEGGVTIVQLRDKTSETADLIRIANALHDITKQYGIPLIINDRADVAIAVGAEGLHIGQDDMSLEAARMIMGKNAIIGVTASSIEEALEAARGGADYLGLGTVYSTATKENAKSIVGPSGIREMLSALFEANLTIDTVCIGSINHRNVQRVLYQTATPKKQLDGVAVVSAIMAAQDPKEAATSLLRLLKKPPPFASISSGTRLESPESLIKAIPDIIARVQSSKPLNHNMTNLVVQNFAANVALAVGSSPIMSSNGLEAEDLAALGGALVINMGSVTPESIANYIAGMRAYNATGNPVVFDPVGGGATSVRKKAVRQLMNEGYFDVIKGNLAEIQAVLGEVDVVQHGVDSARGAELSDDEKARIVKTLAAREHNVVLMTGVKDFLSDGRRTYSIAHGHALLGEITGSGCALGTTIAACVAVEREDKLSSLLAAVLMYEIAAERAAVVPNVRGPGSFVPTFIDELFLIRHSSAGDWLRSARVQQLDV